MRLFDHCCLPCKMLSRSESGTVKCVCHVDTGHGRGLVDGGLGRGINSCTSLASSFLPTAYWWRSAFWGDELGGSTHSLKLRVKFALMCLPPRKWIIARRPRCRRQSIGRGDKGFGLSLCARRWPRQPWATLSSCGGSWRAAEPSSATAVGVHRPCVSAAGGMTRTP